MCSLVAPSRLKMSWLPEGVKAKLSSTCSSAMSLGKPACTVTFVSSSLEYRLCTGKA